MINNTTVLEAINSPLRNIKSYIDLYNEESAIRINSDGALQSYSVERVTEEGKFFGFGICQKATMKLRSDAAAINFNFSSKFNIGFQVENYLIDNFPIFHFENKEVDENSGQITITAYDKLYGLSAHTMNELALVAPYTIAQVA